MPGQSRAPTLHPMDVGNWAMCEAAGGGSMDLVLYFVSQGANDWSERSSNPTSFGRSKAPTLHPADVEDV